MPSLRTALAGSLLSICFSALDLPAQSGLREGLRVRVGAVGAPEVTGAVQSITADSLFIYTEPSGARLGIAQSSIQKVEVSKGRSAAEGAKRGALWGAGIFGGIGTVFAVLLASEEEEINGADDINPGAFFLIATLEGAGIGAIIGALVKRERWERVPVRPMVGWGDSGMRLGVSVPFGRRSAASPRSSVTMTR